MAASRSVDNPRWWSMIDALPRVGGVYAVFAGRSLLYIGKTRLLNVRIRQHHMKNRFIALNADHVEWIECEGTQMACMEKWLIAKHKPLLNGRNA